MHSQHVLSDNLSQSIAAKQTFLNDKQQITRFNAAKDCVVASYKQGGRLYIAGNGGSAADAQHLAAEFVCRLADDRDPIPAEALTVDTSTLTAIGNDYGYDYLFSRQLQAKATSKDVFLGITTSGNSSNIIKALEVCRENQIPSLVFTGKDGGQAKNMADHCIIIDAKRTSIIQELHIVLAHSLCECVELELLNHKSA